MSSNMSSSNDSNQSDDPPTPSASTQFASTARPASTGASSTTLSAMVPAPTVSVPFAGSIRNPALRPSLPGWRPDPSSNIHPETQFDQYTFGPGFPVPEVASTPSNAAKFPVNQPVSTSSSRRPYTERRARGRPQAVGRRVRRDAGENRENRIGYEGAYDNDHDRSNECLSSPVKTGVGIGNEQGPLLEKKARALDLQDLDGKVQSIAERAAGISSRVRAQCSDSGLRNQSGISVAAGLTSVSSGAKIGDEIHDLDIDLTSGSVGQRTLGNTSLSQFPAQTSQLNLALSPLDEELGSRRDQGRPVRDPRQESMRASTQHRLHIQQSFGSVQFQHDVYYSQPIPENQPPSNERVGTSAAQVGNSDQHLLPELRPLHSPQAVGPLDYNLMTCKQHNTSNSQPSTQDGCIAPPVTKAKVSVQLDSSASQQAQRVELSSSQAQSYIRDGLQRAQALSQGMGSGVGQDSRQVQHPAGSSPSGITQRILSPTSQPSSSSPGGPILVASNASKDFEESWQEQFNRSQTQDLSIQQCRGSQNSQVLGDGRSPLMGKLNNDYSQRIGSVQDERSPSLQQVMASDTQAKQSFSHSEGNHPARSQVPGGDMKDHRGSCIHAASNNQDDDGDDSEGSIKESDVDMDDIFSSDDEAVNSEMMTAAKERYGDALQVAEQNRAHILLADVAAAGIEPKNSEIDHTYDDGGTLFRPIVVPALVLKSKPYKIIVRPTNHSRDFFHRLTNSPEVMFELATHLHPKSFLALYSISKDFHSLMNGHMTHCMLKCAERQAPQSAAIFQFRWYSPLCMLDPVIRMHTTPAVTFGPLRLQSQQHTAHRRVPGPKWLQMVVHREKMVRNILACLARNGHRLPVGTAFSIKKAWFVMDIATSARRVQLLKNRRWFTDTDIYYLQMWIIKLDLRFNHPIDGPGDDGLRRLFLGQRGLTPLCRLLQRRDYLDVVSVVRATIRYSWRVKPDRKYLPIMGIPPHEIGIGHLEGWGQGRVHLLRVDELVVREAVRRGLRLQERFLYMMLWGHVDGETGTNIKVRDEEMYMSDDEGNVVPLPKEEEGLGIGEAEEEGEKEESNIEIDGGNAWDMPLGAGRQFHGTGEDQDAGVHVEEGQGGIGLGLGINI